MAGSGGAVVITDEIATDILVSHFFLGDLTGCNMGVVLKLELRSPSSQTVAFCCSPRMIPASLHFDLKVTNVNRYTEDDLVEKAASAIAGAADVFERSQPLYYVSFQPKAHIRRYYGVESIRSKMHKFEKRHAGAWDILPRS